MSADWPHCGQCGGIRIAGGDSCLAHAKPEERAAALKQFSESGDLDVRGVTIFSGLFEEILDAAPHDADGRRTFSAARFDGATFEGEARFHGATFKAVAEFGGATFKAVAEFTEATFEGEARFHGATFKAVAGFGGATFKAPAEFGGATFKAVAWFSEATLDVDITLDEATAHGATFEGLASFSWATFEDVAQFAGATFAEASFGRGTFKAFTGFGGVTFKGTVYFAEVTFEGNTSFSGATFESDAVFGNAVLGPATFKKHAGFSQVTFKNHAEFSHVAFKDARFTGAKFESDVPVLGPLAAEELLDLDRVQFASAVRIEATAGTLTCRRGRFPSGVRFDVHRALVRLDDSDLSVPSLLTGPAVAAGNPSGMTEQPSLLSLQRANVAGLTLGNVNLAACRFARAHNLDKLRLEAGAVFGLSHAVAGWERRQVIAEEAAWRAARARPSRWSGPEWPDSDDKPEVLSPDALAVLYRALRKSREDTKDEPGAADFYYGEMEMRRHDRGTGDASGWRGRATRMLLWTYWLVSGYGLRAWRSLVALAVVTALFALAFHFIGFTQPPKPATYWTGLLYAFRSTVSLTDSQVVLTAWGSFFQALLRITGPVLLGLTLLALRARVKR